MVSLLQTFAPGRLASLCGHGYFAGEAPASGDPDAPDGRAKILNVPSRIRIGIYQRQTMLCVANVLSESNGLWRVNGLNADQHYTVIGFDNAGLVNAAIQDWVKPEPYDPASLRRMHLVGYVAGSSIGQSVAWKVRAAYAVGAVSFTIASGSLPPGWTIDSVQTTCLITGTSTTPGQYTFELAGVDDEGSHASATFVVDLHEGYQFRRIVVTANNGNPSYVTIAEVQLRATLGGTDQTGAGVAIASSEANNDNIAGYAFDNNLGTKWTSNGRPTVSVPQWVRYEFPEAAVVRQIAMTGCIGGQESFAPQDFTIERSVDGLVWEAVASVTGQTAWSGGETRVFDFP